MDYLGYKANWSPDATGDVPQRRLLAYHSQWDLYMGGHPTLIKTPLAYYGRNPFWDAQSPDLPFDQQIPPIGCVHGHHTLADSGYTNLIETDIHTPIAPLFGRDLCGRSIYLSDGPLRKILDDWVNYNAGQKVGDDFPRADLAAVTFPRYCREVPPETAAMLETVFFTKFRCLDISTRIQPGPSGKRDEETIGIYANPNLYPYKLRLDTFYPDGYKLPQIEAVYARQDIAPAKATVAAKTLMTAWENRPDGQDYVDFYEAQGGTAWVDQLYTHGCTLIPTFEACNGYHIVGENFELIDYWPGRAVPGLHAIIATRPDNAPPGTILAVQKPGYVTAYDVIPAKVVVSDGSGYASPHPNSRLPLLPDQRLPHQRMVADWLECYLPTQPAHFEEPAIWGWDAITGLFLQQSGPLWDPLHYYYASVDVVLHAFTTPLPDNRWLAPVPAEMKGRFYPIIPMPGFDTFSETKRQNYANQRWQPQTRCRRVPTETPTCDVGYHPMPLQFEYELDPFWFPELHPLNRNAGILDEVLAPLVAPTIQSQVTPALFLETVDPPPEAYWFTDEKNLKNANPDPLEDYPYILRYLDPDVDEVTIFKQAMDLYLGPPPDWLLNGTVNEIWPDADALPAFLEHYRSTIYDALCDMRGHMLQIVRLRHQLYQNHSPIYKLAWWLGMSAPDLETFTLEIAQARKQATARAALQQPDQPQNTEQEPALQLAQPISAYFTPAEYGTARPATKKQNRTQALLDKLKEDQ